MTSLLKTLKNLPEQELTFIMENLSMVGTEKGIDSAMSLLHNVYDSSISVSEFVGVVQTLEDEMGGIMIGEIADNILQGEL